MAKIIKNYDKALSLQISKLLRMIDAEYSSQGTITVENLLSFILKVRYLVETIRRTLTKEESENLHKFERDHLNTIKTLARIIDASDSYTRGHCDKVAKYSLRICRKMGLSKKKIEAIKTASQLHDIGKIGVASDVLRKSTPLTKGEWEKIKMHPEIGARVVHQAGFLGEIVPIIRHHHERYDGGGYPDGLRKNSKIPLGARIIAVADAFDAMTSDRPYRKAMARECAINELRRCAGSQFDPHVVAAFIG